MPIGTVARRSRALSDKINEIVTETNRLGPEIVRLDTAQAAAEVRPSLMVNGSEGVWQRGAGPFTASGVYDADQQTFTNGGTSTHSISRDSVNVDVGAEFCAAVTYTHGSAVSTRHQKLDGAARVRGLTISYGRRVRTSVANGIRAWVSVDGGTTKTYSPFHTGAGTYETLFVNGVAVPVGATDVRTGVELAVSGTYYQGPAMLVVGPVAPDYMPLHPAEELARCQRYYEVHGGVANARPGRSGYGAAATGDTYGVGFAVCKGGTPTVTKNGTWQVVNCSQPNADIPTPDGYRMVTIITALGAFLYSPNSADDVITAVWDP